MPLAAYLAPVVLVVVAISHQVLTRVTPLTPWKGGGFGMFARTDASASRVLIALGRTADGKRLRIELDRPLVTPTDSRKLRALPLRGGLELIARSCLHHEMVRDGNVLRVPDPRKPQQGRRLIRLVSVTVQVYARALDIEAQQLSLEPIGPEVTLER